MIFRLIGAPTQRNRHSPDSRGCWGHDWALELPWQRHLRTACTV